MRRDLQVVFQDPMASLDPRLPVGDILAEPLRTHGVRAGRARARACASCCALVGLQPGARRTATRRSSPAASGSASASPARWRCEPKLLVLDEPVSALDVSIRAGVINLLEQLRAELGPVVPVRRARPRRWSATSPIASRSCISARIVEIGDVDEVFERPAHPYTQALLSAIPLPDPRKERQRRRIVLQGDLPSPADPPSGCRFRTRCQKFAHELDDDAAAALHRRDAGARRAATGGADHLDAVPLRDRSCGAVSHAEAARRCCWIRRSRWTSTRTVRLCALADCVRLRRRRQPARPPRTQRTGRRRSDATSNQINPQPRDTVAGRRHVHVADRSDADQFQLQRARRHDSSTAHDRPRALMPATFTPTRRRRRSGTATTCRPSRR